MTRFTRAFLDELLGRVDVVSIIEQRVALKKKGHQFWACCPFHQEKTPSFSVHPQKQFFHCFGCGESGNAFDFIMKYDGLSFPDAVESLAELAHVPLPQNNQSAKQADNEHGALLALVDQCARYYQQQLSQSDSAVGYAMMRGLDDEVIATYGIGYAPAQWDAVLKHFGTNQSKQGLLLKAGMLSRNDNGKIYDRFRNRLMFPIVNRRGKTLAFGARVIDANDQPKYLNSPESPIFQKSQELFGLYQLLQHNRKPDWILVTEGYMDVVALAQQGIYQAVATMGTAVSATHLSHLFRISTQVIIAFDGDEAGHRAAQRTLELLLPTLEESHQLRFLLLPEKEDPDSWIKKIGKAAFEQAVTQQAKSLPDYFIHILKQQYDGELANLPQVIATARPLLRSARGGWQLALGQALLQNFPINQTQLDALIIKHPSSKKQSPETQHPYAPTPSANGMQYQHSPVRQLMQLLLAFPTIGSQLPDAATLPEEGLPGTALLKALLSYAQQQPQASTARLLEPLREHPHYSHLVQLSYKPILLENAEQALFNAQVAFDSILNVSTKQELQQLKATPISQLSNEQKKRLLHLSKLTSLSKGVSSLPHS